jgi:hypothetical protein
MKSTSKTALHKSQPRPILMNKAPEYKLTLDVFLFLI